MRSLRRLIVIPALAFALAGEAMAGPTLGHRAIREGLFALGRLDEARVVMLGDSLTEGATWQEITGCATAVNRGIGADTSAGVLRRLDEIVKLKPAAVFLMIGINDVASGIRTDRIAGNVDTIVRRLTRAKARVYLLATMPVADSFKHQVNPQVAELNAAYRRIAQAQGVTLVDFTAQMMTETRSLREELASDGIHLGPDGYRIWRDAILPLVDRHCAPRASDLQATARP